MVTDASEICDFAFEWAELKTLGYIVSSKTEKGEINHCL
jgi:hypothetical protein